jgi:hypothetical protein
MTEKLENKKCRTNFIDKETFTIYSRHERQSQYQQQIWHMTTGMKTSSTNPLKVINPCKCVANSYVAGRRIVVLWNKMIMLIFTQ